jgi:drug/metabolite transporter (DMT)-like permease
MKKLRQMAVWGPALVFLAAMLWSSDAPFRLHLTHSVPANFIVLGEHFFDCLGAVPVLFFCWEDIKKLSWREWLSVLFVAIGGSALGSVFFTQAFHYVNPSVAILLQKVQPLIAIFLAWAILGEQLRPRFWVWCIVALFGAYLVSFPNFVPQTYVGEVFDPNGQGAILALLAATLWGASTVFGKYVLRRAAFQSMTGLRFVMAFVFLIFLNTWQHTFSAMNTLTATDYLFILIIALTSGVFSLYLYYYGLQFTRASIATIAELGFPLAAVFVNAYFIPGNWAPGTLLGLYPGQWVGTAILLFAILKLSKVNVDEVSLKSETVIYPHMTQ